MSMRLRFVLVALGIVALVAIWYLAIFKPNRTKLADLREQVQATEQEISSLQTQLARLQQLQREEPRLRAELARFGDAIPPDPRVPDFILQVQDAANLSGIDFLAITPSVPAANPSGAGVQNIGVSVTTTGTFFEVEDFIFRLERLQRTVKVNSFSVSGEGTLNLSLSMQMFTLAAAAPAPPPAPAPTQGGTAAPTPTPGSA